MLQLIANDKVIETFGDGENNKTLIFQACSGDKVIIQDINEKHTQINIETKK
ncbi:putative 50S ribosomal protein L24 (fragment) [Sulfurovum sp. enrichment culture clone C5]|uniref:Putative 50S ribosomal protein L24 n=1 Tax=Sulfurovum sp. enrichment culture clone C5 TaxID=497650 RepID=A0A0S4XKT1_9BACT